MKVESIHWSTGLHLCFVCHFVGDGASLGGQGLKPAFLRSEWLIGKRKWGHGSTLESFFLFLAVSKGTLIIVVAWCDCLCIHCHSCPTNCGMRIGHRLLEAACGKATFSSLFMRGVLTLMSLLVEVRVVVHDQSFDSLWPSLHVKTIQCCIS